MAVSNSNIRSGDTIAISGDYQYNAYYKGSRLQRAWHRYKIQTALENLDAKGSTKILDVGCGSGVLCSILGKSNPSIQITGIDANPSAIEFCQKKWKDIPNLQFLEGPLHQMEPFPDESIDGIVFLEVIEHINGDQAIDVLREFHGMLKPNGRLIISTPNRKSLWPILEFTMDTFRLAPKMKEEQHTKLYSAKDLKEFAQLTGFKVTKEQTINFLAPWLAVISEKLGDKTHSWESRKSWVPGSLLLFTLVKAEK